MSTLLTLFLNFWLVSGVAYLLTDKEIHKGWINNYPEL